MNYERIKDKLPQKAPCERCGKMVDKDDKNAIVYYNGKRWCNLKCES